MRTVTVSDVRALLDAATSEARARGYKPMAVVVVDAAGQVVGSMRENGASALRLDIAHGKAAAAVGMGVNSRALAARAKDMPAFFAAIGTSAQQPFVPQTGALLLLDESGAVVGAAGASGGSGDEDEQIVMVGIAAAKLGHA
jgi:uncharacterized protein GlcG (DUF336 family)